MRVILMQDVLHTGKRGEIVDVKPGHARNYLIPQGLALEATPGNQKAFEQQRKKIDARHAHERAAAEELAAQINGVQLEIAKRVGESETLYGSVSATEVVHLLEAKGIMIDRRRIEAIMRVACDVLDAEFLFIRHRILDVAAALDRIERAADAPVARGDQRVARISEALKILDESVSDRAERIQMIFSREYHANWRDS